MADQHTKLFSRRQKRLSLAGFVAMALVFGGVVGPAHASVSAPNEWGLVAAGERTVVLATETGVDTTVLNNGTYFYNNPSKSMGFAATSTIRQNSADVLDSSLGDGTCSVDDGGAFRLSWHRGSGNINGGWRYGCVTSLNSNDTAVRAVFHSDTPSYYPAGPQRNVSNATLVNSGWEQCYIGGYGTTVAFSTVSGACSKTYILLAGGVGASVPVLSAPTITSHSSDETSLSFSFSAVANASSYTAYLYAASSGGAPVKTVTGYTSGSAITGLTTGTTYYATIASIGNNVQYASSAESTPRYEATTVVLPDQVITWSPTTSLVLADSGLTLSATLSTGDGTLGYTVVDAGTTGCTVSSTTLSFTSTGSGASGCEVRPTATSTSNFKAKTDASTVTFDVSRGSFAITRPSAKMEATNSSFTNVCSNTCDVSGFASADEIRVVVSAADGSSLQGRVRLISTTGLTQSLSGYQSDASAVDGFAELGFEGTQAEVNAALETLQYKGPLNEVDESVGISASLAGAAYFAGTGHYYEVVSGDNKNHADAITAAATRTFNGLNGYLATILTEEENRFIDSKISDRSVWIGGKYNGTVWQWITGPAEYRIDFWTGTNPGSAISNVYAQWEPGQPDGSDVCLSTNYDGGDADLLGNWDDLTCTQTKKWIVEYGSNGGTVLKEASTSFLVGPPAPPARNGGGSGGGSTTTVAPVVEPPSPTLPRLIAPAQPTPRPTILQGPVTAPGRGFDPSIGTRATIGGAPATVAKRALPSGGLSVEAGAFQFGLNLTDPNGGGAIDNNNPSGTPELRVPSGQSTNFSGGGLLPGSQLQVWLPGPTGNTPKELARVPVRADGTFETELSFTSRQSEAPVPIGRQVMQVAGFDENGNQTVVDMTINVAQGPVAPEPNQAEGSLPQLSPGSSLATSAGLPTAVNVIPIPEQDLLTIGDGQWIMSVGVDGTQGAIEGSSEAPVIRMTQSSQASASGDGFMPGTTASVWMFSEPTLMATVTVDEAGAFTTEFLVDPQFLPAGGHTLQIQGVGVDGFIKSANLGVVVDEPISLTGPSSFAVVFWAVGIFIAILAVLLVVFLLRRRRA